MSETKWSIPRIGSTKLVPGIEKIIQIVNYREDLDKKELIQEMEAIDEEFETNIFSDSKAWLDFTLEENNRSIKILRCNSDNMELTKEGQKLATAEDFERELFNMLLRKSRTNFRYFYMVLNEIDSRVKSDKTDLGRYLRQEVNKIMKKNSQGNRVTAGAIKGFLQDLRIVKRDSKKWEIDKPRYSYLKDDKADLLKGVLKQNNDDMLYEELKRTFVREFDWTIDEFRDRLENLKKQNKLMIDKEEGKRRVYLKV